MHSKPYHRDTFSDVLLSLSLSHVTFLIVAFEIDTVSTLLSYVYYSLLRTLGTISMTWSFSDHVRLKPAKFASNFKRLYLCYFPTNS